MAFFDNFKDKAIDLAQSGVSKSKQVAEITKLNLNNVAEEDSIKKAYIEIGKLYYAERGMAPEAAYAALCEKITAAKVNIEENKSRIEAIKTEGGIVDSEPVITVSESEASSPFAEEDNSPKEPPQE